MPESMTRTTLRLPTELHRQLKMTAAATHTTSEAILVDALRNELGRRGARFRTITIPGEMNPLLAEIFLQSLPTFALIKDRTGRIQWLNAFAEWTLEVRLADVRLRRITDLGLTEGIQDEEINEHIRYVTQKREARMFKEGMKLKGLGRVIIRAQRFMFENRLGDISFVENFIKDDWYPTVTDVLRRMEHTTIHQEISDLLVPFLETAPIAIAIKRPLAQNSVVIWGNTTYLELVKKSRTETFGHTTTQILGIQQSHPIIAREMEVMDQGRVRMSKEHFHEHERWSLRFPIFDEKGTIALLGVISPNFKQSDS